MIVRLQDLIVEVRDTEGRLLRNELKAVVVDLRDRIMAAHEMLTSSLTETIVLACDIAPEVGVGRYDEKLLRHIFGNLLSNAIKYSPQGGRVVFEVRREEGATVFRVADQGIGIPPDEIAHLFESFHRASNVGSIPGTGLGLAIVKNAVEVHGGHIAVESRLGAGTTFTVRLPSAPAAGPARPH